jgi:hypothetical protein
MEDKKDFHNYLFKPDQVKRQEIKDYRCVEAHLNGVLEFVQGSINLQFIMLIKH